MEGGKKIAVAKNILITGIKGIKAGTVLVYEETGHLLFRNLKVGTIVYPEEFKGRRFIPRDNEITEFEWEKIK